MNLQNKRIVVMGLGRFGGGVGVTRFLVNRGADVLVTDLSPADKLTASLQQLDGLPVRYRLGGHDTADFTQADLIVVNPAVDPRNNPHLQAAQAARVPTLSEIRLLVTHLPTRARTIGITGSAGKSTTTAMTGHILRHVLGPQRVHVGGNLGGSLLGELDRIQPDHWVVLELSSFMLEDLDHGRWSPHIAAITNITPNHLDRHGTFEAYVRAKHVILDHQQPEDFALIGRPLPTEMVRPRTTRTLWMESYDNLTARPTPHLLTPGAHNLTNARMALELCAWAGVDRRAGAEALASFTGLPHRLCLVHESEGVRYYDDSKATTPEAALLALRSFAPGITHVILGGYDKHSDLTELSRFAAQHARAIYTIGHTGPTIAHLASPGQAPVHPSQTLAAAMMEIRQRIKPGEVVLLAPGCASWDQFENFEQRGNLFAQLARQAT